MSKVANLGIAATTGPNYGCNEFNVLFMYFYGGDRIRRTPPADTTKLCKRSENWEGMQLQV